MASEGLKRIVQEPSNAPVLKKLVYTTIAMIVFPIVVFFAVRSFASSFVDHGGSNLWGGIAAAVTVNVIMVYYVILAWNEPSLAAEDKKKD